MGGHFSIFSLRSVTIICMSALLVKIHTQTSMPPSGIRTHDQCTFRGVAVILCIRKKEVGNLENYPFSYAVQMAGQPSTRFTTFAPSFLRNVLWELLSSLLTVGFVIVTFRTATKLEINITNAVFEILTRRYPYSLATEYFFFIT